MGATNVMQAYLMYAGKVPPTSMQLLTYMAVVSIDDDREPWYGQGHEALAQLALGRAAPSTAADIRAVERAMTPLFEVGAVSTARRASVRRNGPNTARYRLHLDRPHIPRKTSGVVSSHPTDSGGREPVDNQPRPTESDAHAPRIPDSRPTESGTDAPRVPWDRGTTRNHEEREEDEEHDLRTDLTVVGHPQAASDPNAAAGCDPGCDGGWIRAPGNLHRCHACARDPTSPPTNRGAAA